VISFNVSALIGLSPMGDAGTLPFRDPVVQDLHHRSHTAGMRSARVADPCGPQKIHPRGLSGSGAARMA